MRHLLFVIGIWAFTPAGTASAAVALLDGVTVRVYDAAGLDEGLKQSALAAATRTLTAASIGIHWEHCERADRTCTLPLAPGQLVVRIVRAQKPVPALARAGLALGDAHVDSTARSGVLATIYADRVEMLAAASGIDVATLLGRAIAHEMGHLLLASNVHSTHGLMRARWSRDDLRRGRGADWLFTPKEIAALKARY